MIVVVGAFQTIAYLKSDSGTFNAIQSSGIYCFINMTESNATAVAATIIVILFILQTELFLAYAYWKIVTLFLEGERKMKLLSKLKSTSVDDKREGKQNAGDDSAVSEPKFNEKEKRVIKKAVAITLCFTLCWTLTAFKVRRTYTLHLSY